MKLANRPGLDFKNVFNEFAMRILSKKIQRMVDKEGPMSSDDKMEYTAKITSELKSSLTLNKVDMTQLLVEMGIALKSHEMRLLVDAFDADGDGVVTLNEFLAFTGPKRERHGGSLQAMSSAKCCWLTTCKITGMPNAYAVSNLTRQTQRDLDRGTLQINNSNSLNNTQNSQVRREGKSKMNGERSKDNSRGGGEYADDWDGEDKDKGGNMSVTSNVSVSGRMVIREIKNGEKRMCIELRERLRREDILTKLGVIKKEGVSESKEEEDSHYNDDFDDTYVFTFKNIS